MIRYIPSNRSPILFLNEERLPRADLYIAPETYKRRQELMRERFEQMIAYAANEQECRSAVLEKYFGEENSAPCGVCDVCLALRKPPPGRPEPLPEPLSEAAGDAPGSESILRKTPGAPPRSPADLPARRRTGLPAPNGWPKQCANCSGKGRSDLRRTDASRFSMAVPTARTR